MEIHKYKLAGNARAWGPRRVKLILFTSCEILWNEVWCYSRVEDKVSKHNSIAGASNCDGGKKKVWQEIPFSWFSFEMRAKKHLYLNASNGFLKHKTSFLYFWDMIEALSTYQHQSRREPDCIAHISCTWQVQNEAKTSWEYVSCTICYILCLCFKSS